MTTIGSLFTGYGGLDHAVEAVTGGRTVWRSDIDPGANKIVAHHWPDDPNLGDISVVDWSAVDPVDIITGGFPCTDVSMAGARAGLIRSGDDATRSGLWAMMATAIDSLRPSLVVIENVRGLLSAAADSDVEPCSWCVGDVSGEPPLRALGAVLGDLADIGYDAAWHGLTAASVGAPHGRFRIFIAAWPQSGDAHGINRQGRPTAGLTREAGSQAGPAADTHVGGRSGRAGELRSGRRGQPAYGSDLPADTDGPRLAQWAGVTVDDEPQRASAQRGHRDGCAAANPTGDGRHEWWPEPTGIVGGHDVAERGGSVAADAVGMQPERGRDGRDLGEASTGNEGSGWQRERVRNAAVNSSSVAPDADRAGVEALSGRPWPGDSGRSQPMVGGGTNWGQFEPAIRRWERLTRTAPAPTETSPRGGQRLSPRFVEWMMGLPLGHVTDVPGLTRNDQLKALGNGVVPQQAEAALRVLLNAMAVAA